MTRRKVVLKYIQENSKRKATFRKRKTGLIKKVQELSTLCDIEACAIVYGEDSNEAEVWPSPEEVQTVLAKFQGMAELEQNKRMFNQRSYLTERIVKAQEQLVKHQKDNRKKEITNLMHHCIGIMKIPENLNENDLNDLNLLIDQNLLQIDRQIKNLLQNQAGEGSSEAAQQQTPMDIDHVQGVGAAMPPFGNFYEYGSSSGQGGGAAMPPFGNNVYEYGASSGQGGGGAQMPPFGNNIYEYGASSGQGGGEAQMVPFGNNVYEYGASSGQGGGGAQMPPFGNNVYEYGASSGQGGGGAQMPPFGNNDYEHGASSGQGGSGAQMTPFGNNVYEYGASSGQGGGGTQMPSFGNFYEPGASNGQGGGGAEMPPSENVYGVPNAQIGGAEMPPSQNVYGVPNAQIGGGEMPPSGSFGVPNGQNGGGEMPPFENDCVLPSGPWPYYPNRLL